MFGSEFRKALGILDSVKIVAGIVVGSGIFIVSAEISRQVCAAGGLLVACVITGFFTISGAISSCGTFNAILSVGARASCAVTPDGLSFRRARALNRQGVTGRVLVFQFAWALLLVSPPASNPRLQTKGDVSGSLPGSVNPVAPIFYIVTAPGLFRLHDTRPDTVGPDRCWAHPSRPAMHLAGALFVLVLLFAHFSAIIWLRIATLLTAVSVYVLYRTSSDTRNESQDAALVG
jgi:hypothetical protein